MKLQAAVVALQHEQRRVQDEMQLRLTSMQVRAFKGSVQYREVVCICQA